MCYPGLCPIQFHLKCNNKSKSVSTGVLSNFVSRQLFQEIRLFQKSENLSLCVYPFSNMTVKWRDLTWLCKNPKFNLYQLRKISAVFKIAVLTLKSGITKQLTPFSIMIPHMLKFRFKTFDSNQKT